MRLRNDALRQGCHSKPIDAPIKQWIKTGSPLDSLSTTFGHDVLDRVHDCDETRVRTLLSGILLQWSSLRYREIRGRSSVQLTTYCIPSRGERSCISDAFFAASRQKRLGMISLGLSDQKSFHLSHIDCSIPMCPPSSVPDSIQSLLYSSAYTQGLCSISKLHNRKVLLFFFFSMGRKKMLNRKLFVFLTIIIFITVRINLGAIFSI